MVRAQALTTAEVSLEEIKTAQRENLTSKKTRQKSRYCLYRLLGYSLPSFDGGYRENQLLLLTEFKVFLKHRFKRLLEQLNLFPLVHRMFKWHSRPGKRLQHISIGKQHANV